MEEKQLLKAIREYLDPTMAKYGYKFNSKLGSYLRIDGITELYFEISLSFMDYVSYVSGKKTKYLEIYTNVYHKNISQLLLEHSSRKFLGSLYYFKLIGNLLSDIVLNKDNSEYTSRSNHNYFKIIFESDDEINSYADKILQIIELEAIPFFCKVDTLEKIKDILDTNYSFDCVYHNIFTERLLVLAVLLYKLNDPEKEIKLLNIENVLNKTRNSEALLELIALNLGN